MHTASLTWSQLQYSAIAKDMQKGLPVTHPQHYALRMLHVRSMEGKSITNVYNYVRHDTDVPQ